MPSSNSVRHRTRWAGIPAEDRISERRALLVDAAFDLLGTEGSAATTVRAVCQRARLNPRYFYESFEDLDALVVAVYDRLVDDLRDELQTAVDKAGTDAAAQVRAVVQCTVRFVDEDRRRGRVLYGEALGNEALNRRRIETGFATAEVMAAANGQVAQRIAAAIIVGGFSELLMAWLDGRIKASRAQLVDQTTAMFLAVAEAAGSIAAKAGKPGSAGRRRTRP